jgi:hypothetical protein
MAARIGRSPAAATTIAETGAGTAGATGARETTTTATESREGAAPSAADLSTVGR